jgi:predicted RNA-binding protein YlxR (DUF448 family)/ribosomal protein L30E
MAARSRHSRSMDAEAHEGPERTCAVTRAKLPPEELIRFVRAPDGSIVPDLSCRLPGRGVWVTNNRDQVAVAARTNVFARSLKQTAVPSPDLAELVEDLMVRRCRDALSLATKAGLVVAGFTKTDVAVGRGEAVALIHASDAAEDGRGKLDRKFKAVLAAIGEETGKNIPPRTVTDFTSTELSLAIGRSHVVHAALTKGGAAELFLKEAERLKRYRSISKTEAAVPSSPGLDTERV